MMDLAILPAEFERSKTKIAKIDRRKELASGWGSTTGGMALAQHYHERLTEGFRVALLDAHAGSKHTPQLVVTLRGLSPELLALVSIQTILHGLARSDNLTPILRALGLSVSGECWAAKLTLDNTGIASRIERAARAKYTNTGRRKSAMGRDINAAVHAGKLPPSFKTMEWAPEALVLAGAWLWNVTSAALPEVFVRSTLQSGPRSKSSVVALSEGSKGIVQESLDRAMISRPVYWPTSEAPKPWTFWADGGAWDERIRSSLLRTHHKETQAATKQAIKSGQMQPALDALNALQSVAFKINFRVLEVLQQCSEMGIAVKGLAPKDIHHEPRPNAFAWEAMDKSQQAHFHQKNAEIATRNRSYFADRLLFAEDMNTAYAMLEHSRFYTPMNCDWRGRVYGLCHFNFQRDDRVRALFLFADGAEIGEDGIEWLKVHAANCGDFGIETPTGSSKISKRPIKERIEWCNTHGPMIMNIASDPLVHTKWTQADKPFLFLAACFELSAALAQGSSYMTHLPISFDGSCSGLQHLSAMTRAAEGVMVNLTPSALPQDVYQVIAEDAFAAIAADEEHAELSKLFTEFDGNRRTIVKRNVMTYAYSSKKFGMAAQQQVDLIQPLADKVLDGEAEEHPFEGYQYGPYDKHGNQQPSKAARFLAHHVYEAIVKRIHKPAEAMEFLQKIARALAHEGKPVQWTTPVGIPWINRYHEPIVERIELFLNDGGVKVRTRVNVTTGGAKTIDKAKASNGVAPNFVHALDAAHLMLVANAAKLEGITSMATVHDSFGCLASQATRFNQIIREQFALMYETHDVLKQILERATGDLTEANRSKLPALPTYGTLNLKDILDAPFAFA
jgi:DNA-directed RNA polymerase